MKALLLIILIGALAWFGYQYYQEHRTTPAQVKNNEPANTPSTNNFKIQKCTTPDGRVIYLDHTKDGQCENLITETKTLKLVHNEKISAPEENVAQKSTEHPIEKPSFKCDGRTHCSQMHSCEEAKYFINNCPNTEMDGDHDGTPCETQWCSH